MGQKVRWEWMGEVRWMDGAKVDEFATNGLKAVLSESDELFGDGV